MESKAGLFSRNEQKMIQFEIGLKHMGVSWNGGTPKTPQNGHLVGKP